PVSTNDALPAIRANITLVGGRSTTIRRDPATTNTFRILEVAAGGTLRVEGIFVLNGFLTGNGGGILNAGTLVLNHVTLSGNSAGTSTANGGDGGGLANTGQARIFNTLISGNKAFGSSAGATGAGGGIFNTGTGDVRLFNSRLSINTAEDGGGGIDTGLNAESRIIQSTIDHNLVPAGGTGGGGIFNVGKTSLDRSLVTLNRAPSGGGVFNVPPGTVTVMRSIIRNNTPNNCVPLNTIAGCTN
ncbi:MAG TPA: hypothetical protein VE198_01835, partial [Actinoallomurus sp.]|nr:hypothetical protein [Actinoallomurus sp.]